MVQTYTPNWRLNYYGNGAIEIVEKQENAISKYIAGFETVEELATLIRSNPTLAKELKEVL